MDRCAIDVKKKESSSILIVVTVIECSEHFLDARKNNFLAKTFPDWWFPTKNLPQVETCHYYTGTNQRNHTCYFLCNTMLRLKTQIESICSSFSTTKFGKYWQFYNFKFYEFWTGNEVWILIRNTEFFARRWECIYIQDFDWYFGPAF